MGECIDCVCRYIYTVYIIVCIYIYTYIHDYIICIYNYIYIYIYIYTLDITALLAQEGLKYFRDKVGGSWIRPAAELQREQFVETWRQTSSGMYPSRIFFNDNNTRG